MNYYMKAPKKMLEGSGAHIYIIITILFFIKCVIHYYDAFPPTLCTCLSASFSFICPCHIFRKDYYY